MWERNNTYKKKFFFPRFFAPACAVLCCAVLLLAPALALGTATTKKEKDLWVENQQSTTIKYDDDDGVYGGDGGWRMVDGGWWMVDGGLRRTETEKFKMLLLC